MKKLFFALALTITPVLASPSDGTTPIIYFRKHDPAYPVVACVKPENIPAADGPWFPWEPVNGDLCAQHYSFNSGGLVYAPPPPPLDIPQPNPDAFIDAVATNDSISTDSFMAAWRCSLIKNEAARKAAWAAQSSGVPAPQKAVIEAAALAAGMPLR